MNQSPDQVKDLLRQDLASLGSLRKVAAKWQVNIRYVSEWIKKDHEPTSNQVRAKFGLTPIITNAIVLMMGDPLPPGVQVYSASLCKLCGSPYISNHPSRTKCFICSPFKRHKRKPTNEPTR